jgi:hypothetical protein
MQSKKLIGPRGLRGPRGEKGDIGLTCSEITVPCEHRFTSLESAIQQIRTNDLPHLQDDVTSIKKMLWGIIIAVCSGFIGLVIFVIKGHITF